MRLNRLTGLMLIILMLLVGCNLTDGSTDPGVAPYASPIADSESGEWEPVATGVWMRSIPVPEPYAVNYFEMLVIKIDPAQTRIQVHYTPQEMYLLPDWATFLENEILIVNASFFTEEAYAVGLVASDSQYYGYSLEGFGGMLQVQGDQVRVRSLVQEPFSQGEQYDQVVQGFPMLIEPHGQPASTGAGFDDPARRTLIAQDREGYIYLMVTPAVFDRMSLRNLQNWLLNTDLGLDVAFGLDGGKSSGIFIHQPDDEAIYTGIDPVAVVIAVYPR